MAKTVSTGEDDASPVLAVGLGRGHVGKSVGLAELIWRARSQGRNPIIADGDPRSKTLSDMFPGEAASPPSEETGDVKLWLTSLLNQMVREKRSAVLDLGGGDKALMDFGRDLPLVQFCERRGIAPVALFFMGPDDEDFRHVESIWSNGTFKPKRVALILNEGVLRDGQTVAGAFEKTMAQPGLQRMVAEGAKPFLMQRLAAMNVVKTSGRGFYAASSGDAALDPVEEFMTESWLTDLEGKRERAGVANWMP